VDESVSKVFPAQLHSSVASRVGEILEKNSNIRRKKYYVTSTYVESALLAMGVTEERLERKQ
jgi:hypothetical protein